MQQVVLEQVTGAASGTTVQQVVLDVQPTVVATGHGVPAVVIVTVVAGVAETPVLPVPVVAGVVLVALAVPVDAGQLATAGAHSHVLRGVVIQLELEAYLDK